MADEGGDKTEQPTDKKLDDARKRGQVPRSRDLGAAAVTLTGGGVLYGLGSLLGQGLVDVMRSGLALRDAAAIGPERLPGLLGAGLAQAGIALAPLFGLTLAAALLALGRPAEAEALVGEAEALLQSAPPGQLCVRVPVSGTASWARLAAGVVALLGATQATGCAEAGAEPGGLDVPGFTAFVAAELDWG